MFNPAKANQDSQFQDPILDVLGIAASDSESDIYQEAAAALAYSAPAVPFNPDLKSRLFGDLGLPCPEPDIMELLNLSIQELKEHSASLPWNAMEEAPGFEIAPWRVQDETRKIACFIRAERTASFPNHYHPDEEVIVLLAGDLVDEGRAYQPGDRIEVAAETSHLLKTTQGCLLFCVASQDNHFIE